MVELLAAALSGANTLKAASAWNKVPAEEGGNIGHFFMAIDVSKITDDNEFAGRVEYILDTLASGELTEGVSKIYYPGAKEKAAVAAATESGTVNVADSTIAAIEALINE